jgi:hypothetical protein
MGRGFDQWVNQPGMGATVHLEFSGKLKRAPMLGEPAPAVVVAGNKMIETIDGPTPKRDHLDRPPPVQEA